MVRTGVVSPRAAAAGSRHHTGELYDAIWALAVPPLVVTEGKRAGRLRRDGQPVVEVGSTAVRLVLMAMAKHTNPTRDEGQFRCCPSIETIAELADVSPRVAQLVIARCVELGYIDIEQPGLRAGRNRPARPTWWRLRPDRWPRRALHGGEAGVATNAEQVPMVAQPAASPTTNGRAAGCVETPMVAKPAAPKPGIGLTRKTGVPPLGVAEAEDGAVVRKPEDSTQPALPRMGAVALAPPGQGSAEGLLAAFYRGLGTDMTALTPPLRRRELAIAAQLVAVDATPAEAEAYAREASTVPGRIAPVDLRAFERERASWLARRRHSTASGPRLIDRTGQPPSWSSASVGERAAGERHDSTAGAIARAVVGGGA